MRHIFVSSIVRTKMEYLQRCSAVYMPILLSFGIALRLCLDTDVLMDASFGTLLRKLYTHNYIGLLGCQ